MEQPNGWFKELMIRRVPQFVGLYIAATWMTIEIGEWISGRLGWPDQVVFYVFILMVALLPSVGVLAWNHGAPGRDESPRYEKWFLPVNTLVGLIFLFALVGLGPFGPSSGIGEAQGATVERVVVDETGREQTFTVAREGFHTRAASFFWSHEGDGSPTWENYAIAWLLAVDLGRDPLLSVSTPWEQGSVERLQAAGYEHAVREPVSLALQIARDDGAGMLIRGRYEQGATGYRLHATVVEVDTGILVAEREASGGRLVDAVAQLADRIGPDLYGNVTRDPNAFVDIQLSDATTSSPEALERLVNAVNTIAFEKDFAVAAHRAREAIDLDPQFALAYVWLQRILRFGGDMDAAADAIEGALALDYKLDSTTLFALKASLYAVRGELDKAIRVHEMWAEVHPESLEALLSLAKVKAAIGELDAARVALEKARTVDPDNAEIDRQSANVMEASGNSAGAAEMLDSYLQAEPDDSAAWLQLGQIYFRAGNSESARNALERAAILAGSDFEAQLELARLEAYNGDLQAAIDTAGGLIADRAVASERASASLAQATFLFLAGRLEEALAVLEAQNAEIRRSLSPLAYPQMIANMKSMILLARGRYQATAEMLDTMESELVAPVDAIMDIYRMSLHEQTGNLAGAQASLQRLRFFRDEFAFPGRDAILSLVQARMAVLQGNPEASVELMRGALESNRQSIRALNFETVHTLEFALVRYLRSTGRLDDARALLVAMLERHPNQAEARLELAEIEYESGRAELSRQHLDLVLEQWSGADQDYLAYRRARDLAEKLSSQRVSTSPDSMHRGVVVDQPVD